MKASGWFAVLLVVAAASALGTYVATQSGEETRPFVVATSTTYCSAEITDACYAEAKIRARSMCREEKRLVVAVEVTIDRGVQTAGDFLSLKDDASSVAVAQRLPFVETMTCRRLLNFE